MDLNLFKEPDAVTDVTGTFSDAAKMKEIAEKLCIKRKALEDKASTITPEDLATYSEELLELKDSMKAFGISDIEYEIYLAEQNKVTE